MQRYFALLVVILLGLMPAVAAAQDAGGADAAAAVDAAPAAPDAAPSNADGGLAYPPALADEQGCDCQAGGRAGVGAVVLVGAIAFGLRRSSRR